MSAIAESTDVVVEPRRGPRLGPKGLAAFTILIFAATLGIVAVAVLCFPEVIDEQLPVTILVDGYIAPEEVDASVKRYQEGTGEVLEPYLTVRNDSDQPLTSVYMRLNRNFIFHPDKPLPPGEEMKFYLSRFQEPDGSRFWPHRYSLSRVEVRGRLPSLKQAILVTTWEDLVNGNSGRMETEATGEESPAANAGVGGEPAEPQERPMADASPS